VRAVLSLSAVYFGVDHLISARRVLDRSLEEQPRNEALWQRRGEVALQEEDYGKAVESFRNAVIFGDSTALNLRNLGVGLYLDKQYAEAHDLLEKSYQADSSDGMGAFYLGMAKMEREAFEDALRYFDRATELMGVAMIAEVELQAATTYDRMDRDGDAIRAYRLALGLDPARREILFHLAALYDAYYADKNAAMEQYELFLTRVGEDELTQQQDYARQRIRELKERRFFDQPDPERVIAPESLDVKTDTSGAGR
jgi:tetratricopeptide (TPR) repeat protein